MNKTMKIIKIRIVLLFLLLLLILLLIKCSDSARNVRWAINSSCSAERAEKVFKI